jgi:hypothetical protein
MYKIAITGSADYVKESKVAKFIKKIYDTYGPTATILSGGEDRGPEYWSKKYCLEFGMKYKEYNPSYTGMRMYSALNESYYGKKYHISHIYDRYKRMLYDADKLVIFNSDNSSKESNVIIENVIKTSEKLKIKPIIIN